MTVEQQMIQLVVSHPEFNGITTTNDDIPGQQIIGVNVRQQTTADPVSGATIIYDDSFVTVYSVTTYAAGVKLGLGTQWDFAVANNNTVISHLSQSSPVIIAIPKDNSGQKFYFHFPSKDFKDGNLYCILDEDGTFCSSECANHYLGKLALMPSIRHALHDYGKLHWEPKLYDSAYIASKLDMANAVVIDPCFRRIFTEIETDSKVANNNKDIVDYYNSKAITTEEQLCAEIDTFYTTLFSTTRINSQNVYVIMNPHANPNLGFYNRIISINK